MLRQLLLNIFLYIAIMLPNGSIIDNFSIKKIYFPYFLETHGFPKFSALTFSLFPKKWYNGNFVCPFNRFSLLQISTIFCKFHNQFLFPTPSSVRWNLTEKYKNYAQQNLSIIAHVFSNGRMFNGFISYLHTTVRTIQDCT